MGAEFRLVILEGCDRLSKDVSEPLIEYLNNSSPTTVCMVVAERLAKNTRLYKAISKIGAGAILDCSPIKYASFRNTSSILPVSMAGA